MLNLLPKDYKDKVRREYLRRFTIVMLIGLSVIGTFLLVAIFPSYSSVSLRNRIAEEAKKSLVNSDKANDRNIVLGNIKDLESRLDIVAIITGDRPTDYIDKALELKGRGISIKNISYVKKDDLLKEISLEGVASNRSNLIEFSKRVTSSDWATHSDIPLSNLASDRDIQFFVILTATSTPNEL